MESNSGSRPFMETPMTVEEAAEIAKISPRTIHRWIKSGLVRSFGAGRSPRVLMTDVLPERPARTTVRVH